MATAPNKRPPNPAAPVAKMATGSLQPHADPLPSASAPPEPVTSPARTLDVSATAATPAAAPAQPPSAFQPKVYQPGDIACSHQNDDMTNCGAEPGEPCVWQQQGMGGTFHAERIADAAAASQREGIKPTTDQFDEAVWDSGLV